MKRKIGYKEPETKQENRGLPNRWWPAIFCMNENKFIGISDFKLPYSGLKIKYKVDKKHWTTEYARFRNILYAINFENLVDGQKVICPMCGNTVDFRLWKSATKPEFE